MRKEKDTKKEREIGVKMGNREERRKKEEEEKTRRRSERGEK